MNLSTPQISRRFLHDQVADWMRRLIQTGELEPKSRINELELAEQFGISRTPLREAIKILASEGWFEILPNRGARVVSLSGKDISEVMEVIAALEGAAAELAQTQMTDAEFAAIERRHQSMIKAWKRGDNKTYIECNRAIHAAIVDASRNDTLRTTYSSLSSRIQNARYTAHKSPEDWQRAVDEHELMIEHLRNRDGAALADVLRKHIRGKKDVVMAAYALDKPQE